MKQLIKIISIILLLHVIGLFLLYMLQELLLFHPIHHDASVPYTFKNPSQDVKLISEDGITLHHILFEVSNPNGVVLFFHGNGGTAYRWGKRANVFLSCGYSVLFTEYRGYGKSEGRIRSENQLMRDAQQAYDYLADQYADSTIVIAGYSIGSGIAARLASVNRAQELILYAPYSSLTSLIKDKAKVIPEFIIRYKFSTADLVNQIACPVSILHGQEDNIIPIHHSNILKEIRPSIQFHSLPDCNHRVNACQPNFNNYTRQILLTQ